MVHYLKKNKSFFSLGSPTAIGMLLWIAEQKGFIADHKVKIRLEIEPYSRRGMERLMAGELDCALLVETNVAYLGYLKPKFPVKCLASVEQGLGDSIILRHEKGYKATPRDLEGKRVAFLPQGTSHHFLARFLEKHGIDKRSLTVTDMTPQAMPGALIRNDVDAISIWEPHANNTKHAMDELGISYTHFENEGFYKSEVALVTTKPFLVKNRRAIGGFLKALKAAENFNRERRSETIPLLAQKLKITGANPEKILDKMIPELSPIGENYKNNIFAIAEWIREKDTRFQGHPLPDYGDFIDNSLFFDIFGKNAV